MNKDQLHSLLYEALETEKGGVLVYETALRCAINEDLKEEWGSYLQQTRHHIQVLLDVFRQLGMNPDQETPGRNIVRLNGQGLVKVMEVALSIGTPEVAQVVAAECVVVAETKDHLNWELLAAASEDLTGVEQKAFRSAVEDVEDEEDEHLYHSTGWARELHLEALGLEAESRRLRRRQTSKRRSRRLVFGRNVSKSLKLPNESGAHEKTNRRKAIGPSGPRDRK